MNRPAPSLLAQIKVGNTYDKDVDRKGADTNQVLFDDLIVSFSAFTGEVIQFLGSKYFKKFVKGFFSNGDKLY